METYQSVWVLKKPFWWRKVICFQFQMFSSFRVSLLDQSNKPDVTHTFRLGGFIWFMHPRRDAVDEPLYNPVSLPCYLFGQKSQKRLQPEGVVFLAALPVSSASVLKETASGNGGAFAHPRSEGQPGCCALRPSRRRVLVYAPCCERMLIHL